MWDLPGPGLEPVSPALAGRFITTVPPGKSRMWRFVSPDVMGLRVHSGGFSPKGVTVAGRPRVRGQEGVMGRGGRSEGAEEEKTSCGGHGPFAQSEPMGATSPVDHRLLGPPIRVPLLMVLECKGL